MPAPLPTSVRPTPSPTVQHTATPIATALPRPPAAVTPRAQAGGPAFSEAARRTPAEAVAYLAGRLPEYPGGGAGSVLDFAASDILETMDTVVLDDVKRQRGGGALQQVYDAIARAVLTTLREQYGERRVLVPLDAGHGGQRGVAWDGGAGGTEADHNRAVVAAMLRLAQAPELARIALRPIHNDEMADGFGLPPRLAKIIVDRILIRQVRASMLAAEAVAWNRAHPDPAEQVVVHEIAVHFNAGAGGAMVLHQGETVRREFATRSVDFARRYLQRVTAVLNASGLLPASLRLWGGNGLHDDVMMYRPDYLSDEDIRGLTLRYGALQGGGYLPRYVGVVLANSTLR